MQFKQLKTAKQLLNKSFSNLISLNQNKKYRAMKRVYIKTS